MSVMFPFFSKDSSETNKQQVYDVPQMKKDQEEVYDFPEPGTRDSANTAGPLESGADSANTAGPIERGAGDQGAHVTTTGQGVAGSHVVIEMQRL